MSGRRENADHIRTTHVGSLIRPEKLQALIRTLRDPETRDEAAYERCLRESVAEIVRRQIETGIDIVDDGEFGKTSSWSRYALDRLGGFERRPSLPGNHIFARGADRTRFPEFYDEHDQETGHNRAPMEDIVCVGPVSYIGDALLQRDIANLKAALEARATVDAFLPVSAPGSTVPYRKNEHYRTEDECTAAIAEAMHAEYRMIVEAGFLVQLDDAHAATGYDSMVPPGSFKDYRRFLAQQVELINHALRGIPEDRVRYHICWGSWPGPHTTDVPLKDVVDQLLKIRAGAYLIEQANPRHAHEWQVWDQVKLPDGKILVPGLISHATNVVEHPELVAQRIVRLATLVGRENVIASTDCGFAQSPFQRRVHPTIMWAKLQSLVEGARLATKALWPRRRAVAKTRAR